MNTNSDWKFESIVPGFGEVYVSKYGDFKLIRLESRIVQESVPSTNFWMKHIDSNVAFFVSSMENAFDEFKKKINEYSELFTEIKQAIEDTQKPEENND